MQPTDAAPPAENPTASGGSDPLATPRPARPLIPVEVAYELGFSPSLVLFSVFGAIVSVALIIFLARGGALPTVRPLRALVALSPMILFALAFRGWLGVMRRRATAAAVQFVAESDPKLPTQIGEYVTRWRGPWLSRGMLELARTLARAAQTGRTIQICAAGKALAPQPLSYGFEPVPLPAAHTLMNESPEPSALGRSIRRNLLLRGGFAIVVVFGINFIIALIESVRLGRPKTTLYLWGLAILMLLLSPADLNLLRNRQWLLVPGGALRRVARWRDSRWTLHLFDRERSVLIAYASGRERWRIVLADAEHCDVFIATRTEAEWLLRAWLSPAPPPALERLGEFADAGAR